jgi:phosphoglycolate phosphatase-like HAD superfamily hydrolase
VGVDEVVLVGDYKFDLLAARAAGMKTILYCDESPLPGYASMTDVVVRGFGELKERWEQFCHEMQT